MSPKPRKVLIRLTDDQWNAFRGAAVGRHGLAAGALATRLVLEYLELGGEAAMRLDAAWRGQMSLDDAIAADRPAKPAPRRRTAPGGTKKGSAAGRRTRK